MYRFIYSQTKSAISNFQNNIQGLVFVPMGGGDNATHCIEGFA
jgi:hypothetical protein